MKMAIGSDSTCNLTDTIVAHMESKGIELVRCGALAGEQADYVDAASGVSAKVSDGSCEQGLLFCNTGTGVTIVANKIPGVRAALAVDPYSAQIARLANNASVIVLGMRLTGETHAKEIVDTWLATEPSTEPLSTTITKKS